MLGNCLLIGFLEIPIEKYSHFFSLWLNVANIVIEISLGHRFFYRSNGTLNVFPYFRNCCLIVG